MNKRPADQEEKLEEALEETFPASDAPANTVETGIAAGVPPAFSETVRDNREASRFELVSHGETAFLSYQRRPGVLVLVHTEVPPSLRGQHLGEALAKAGLEAARAEGLRADVRCRFVLAYMRKHPELAP